MLILLLDFSRNVQRNGSESKIGWLWIRAVDIQIFHFFMDVINK